MPRVSDHLLCNPGFDDLTTFLSVLHGHRHLLRRLFYHCDCHAYICCSCSEKATICPHLPFYHQHRLGIVCSDWCDPLVCSPFVPLTPLLRQPPFPLVSILHTGPFMDQMSLFAAFAPFFRNCSFFSTSFRYVFLLFL